MTSSRDSEVVAIAMPSADLALDSPSDDECREESRDEGRSTESRADGCCRTTLAFLFLFYNMTLNLFVLAVVHERVPTQIKQPLPDIGFDLLPKADWTLSIAEYVIIAQMTAVFVLLFLHRYRWVSLLPPSQPDSRAEPSSSADSASSWESSTCSALFAW